MWEVIAGALKLIGQVISGGQWAYEKLRGNPVKVIERRAELRAAFFKHMPAHDNEFGIHGEVIVRNLRVSTLIPIKTRKKESSLGFLYR